MASPMPDDRPVSPERWNAPWTAEQVAALRAHQLDARFHPYTCANDSSHPVLCPTQHGWVCEGCGYRQTWAHAAALSTPAGPSPEATCVKGTIGCTRIGYHCSCVPAPSPREEAVEVHRLDVEAARDYVLDIDGEPARDLVANLEVALSAARPSSPTPEETREVEALREAAHAAHEFAGNVIRYATGPVKPELWEDDSPLVEQAWAVVRATDPGAATTKEGR